MGDGDWGSFWGFGWPGRGISLVGVSGPLCKWEMRIGVVFGGLGGLEGIYFLVGGCLVHCVGGRWGLEHFSGVWGPWKGFFFSDGRGVWSTVLHPPSPPSPPTRVSSKKSIAILTC